MIEDVIKDFKFVQSETGTSNEVCASLLMVNELRDITNKLPDNFWDAFSQMIRVIHEENLGIPLRIVNEIFVNGNITQQ